MSLGWHWGALGTTRVLKISPSDFRRIGSMQYAQTLPLKDHEVVITSTTGRYRPIPTLFSTRWLPNA
jgi:hypothetical protein